MARKKSKRVQRKAAQPKAEKKFSCLECNSEHTVACTMNYAKRQGKAACAHCGHAFFCTINSLSLPIDVYSEWVDAKEERQRKRTEDEAGEKGREVQGDREEAE